MVDSSTKRRSSGTQCIDHAHHYYFSPQFVVLLAPHPQRTFVTSQPLRRAAADSNKGHTAQWMGALLHTKIQSKVIVAQTIYWQRELLEQAGYARRHGQSYSRLALRLRGVSWTSRSPSGLTITAFQVPDAIDNEQSRRKRSLIHLIVVYDKVQAYFVTVRGV